MDKKKVLLAVLAGMGIIFIILIIFLSGVFVGQRTGFRRLPPFVRQGRFFERVKGFRYLMNGHGVFGKIESIGDETLVVENREGTLKTVLINPQTKIRERFQDVNFSDLKPESLVVVIGAPSEERDAIIAKLIRVVSKK